MALMTGQEYMESLNDGREVYIDGEKVKNIAEHPSLRPIIEAKARMYDMNHEAQYKDICTVDTPDGTICRGYKMPETKDDLKAIRKYVETVLDDLGGVVYRVGDETIGEMWSLYDAQESLNEIDPTYTENIKNHIERISRLDLFHVSANTDPKGDRSKLFAGKAGSDTNLLHVVEENDRGIVVSGAKFETAAAYAHQAFVKPTISNWTDESMLPYASGFICDMGSPGLKHICRTSHGRNQNPIDYPISTQFDEIDTLLIFDKVLIPWENVLFHNNLKSVQFIRKTVHRYSAFNYVIRLLRRADLLLGTAVLNAEQTGLTKIPAVQEKITKLICYRESINAHLTAAVSEAEESTGGLLMPNQSLLYTGRIQAISNFNDMLHLTRELVGGQLAVTPDSVTIQHPEVKEYIDKYYSLAGWDAEDRTKLLFFARDLLNSSRGGHQTTFELFAQGPPFTQYQAAFSNFDLEPSRQMVRKAANIFSEKAELQV